MTGTRIKKLREVLPDVETEKINSHKWQIRFNFVEIAAITTGPQPMPASFQYDYINVEEWTKKAIKKAIIETKYDHDDELCLINEQTTKPANYQVYIDLRTLADTVFSKVLIN